jgi:hypothetical protein
MTTNTEWQPHDGTGMPVPYGTLVDVRHRDGDVFFAQPAGVRDDSPNQDDPSCGFAHDWTADGFSGGDIIAYRVHTPAPEQGETA